MPTNVKEPLHAQLLPPLLTTIPLFSTSILLTGSISNQRSHHHRLCLSLSVPLPHLVQAFLTVLMMQLPFTITTMTTFTLILPSASELSHLLSYVVVISNVPYFCVLLQLNCIIFWIIFNAQVAPVFLAFELP